MDGDIIVKNEPLEHGDDEIEYLLPYENEINNPAPHTVEIIYEPAGNDEIEIDESQIKIEPSIDETSERAITVQSSVQTAQSAQPTYECYGCKNSFIHLTSLQSHLKQCVLLTSTKAFQCKSCDKSYETKRGLQKHILHKHKENRFKCTECPKKFAIPSELKYHMTTHDSKSTGGSFTCPKCNKTFRWKKSLKDHMNIHLENNPFDCSVCSQKCSSLSDLKKHETVHTDNRPFSCEVCDEKFKTNGSLQQHILTHKEKRFQCEICGKKFASKRNKNRHMPIHDRKKAHPPTPSTSFDSTQ